MKQRCRGEAVQYLIQGGGRQFSVKVSAVFLDVHRLVIRGREKLGYLEFAAQIYDGTKLWKRLYSEYLKL